MMSFLLWFLFGVWKGIETKKQVVMAVQAWVGKEFQTQSISEGSKFILRARSRDNEGAANAGVRPPDRPGRVDTFPGHFL